MALNGLSQINVEISSICNKNCGLCGRRKYDREHGTQDYGYMPLELVKTIAEQIPENITIGTHWNGEPLTHPQLGEALTYLKKRNCFIYAVSNGKLLMEKRDDIANNLSSISISVIEGDEEWERELQYKILKQYISSVSYLNLPVVILRFVGIISDEQRYIELGLPIVRRTLHAPQGSFNYRKPPVIPEHGVCQDLLSRLAVDRYGNISICVRLDIEQKLVLGNINDGMTLDQAWNSEKRLKIKELHITGKRHESGFCHTNCQFYGVPTSD